MPSRIIHLCVAEQVLRRTALDRDLFILGNLAPDCHPDASDRKDNAHFRAPKAGRTDDLSHLGAFRCKNMAGAHDHLVSGYYCHLLVDNLWLLDLYHRYGDPSPAERALRSRQCYRDYQLLNQRLIGHFSLLRPSIRIPDNLSMQEIDREQLHLMITGIAQDFALEYCADEPLTFLQSGQVIEFIEGAADSFLRSLAGNTYP